MKNREALDDLIEQKLQQRTTAEWLKIFKGGGVPYAAINDIKGTLNHEHGKITRYTIEIMVKVLTYD